MAKLQNTAADSVRSEVRTARKRIGVFIDTQAWGGAEAVVLSCCQALQDSEFEPVLLHFENEELARKCISHGIEALSVPGYGHYKRGARLPLFAISFARFLRAHHIALLHSHLYGPIVAGALAARLSGRPHVGTLHDIYVIEESSLRLPPLCLARLLGTTLVAVSEDMRNHYAGKRCLRRARISTIYNGISVSTSNSASRQEFRERWQASEEDIVFICVARFVALKRQDMLVNAFAELRDLPNVRLVLYGEGPEQQAVSELVRDKGIGDRVILAGHSEQIDAALDAADAFVLSSETEGLSRSILEAMAHGLPIVATDVGGNRELVTDNGILAAAGNPGELAAAMRRLATDAERRRKLGRNSRTAAANRFSGEAMINSYSNIYREMLDG